MIGVVALRVLALVILWIAFTEGDLSGLPIALGSIATAAAAWQWVAPPVTMARRLQLVAIPRFALFFVRRSAAGGLDVAWRALHPALPIAPTLLQYRVATLDARPRLLFAHVVSLLPGTLACRLEGELLTVHAIDGGAPVEQELRRLEAEVARLFAAG